LLELPWRLRVNACKQLQREPIIEHPGISRPLADVFCSVGRYFRTDSFMAMLSLLQQDISIEPVLVPKLVFSHSLIFGIKGHHLCNPREPDMRDLRNAFDNSCYLQLSFSYLQHLIDRIFIIVRSILWKILFRSAFGQHQCIGLRKSCARISFCHREIENPEEA